MSGQATSKSVRVTYAEKSRGERPSAWYTPSVTVAPRSSRMWRSTVITSRAVPVVGECLGRGVGEVVDVDEGLPAVTGGQPELALLAEEGGEEIELGEVLREPGGAQDRPPQTGSPHGLLGGEVVTAHLAPRPGGEQHQAADPGAGGDGGEVADLSRCAGGLRVDDVDGVDAGQRRLPGGPVGPVEADRAPPRGHGGFQTAMAQRGGDAAAGLAGTTEDENVGKVCRHASSTPPWCGTGDG